MRNFDEKRRLRRFIYSRLTIVILLILLLLLLRSVFEAWQREREARSGRDAALRSYEEMTARQENLANRLTRLTTPAGQEAELREKYGAAAPGEEVIVIVDHDNNEAAATQSSSGFWAWLRGLF